MTAVLSEMHALNEIIQLREDLTSHHPIITASAKISTDAVMNVLRLVKKAHTRKRSSIAFWARQLMGKTYCIDICRKFVEREYPGSGHVTYEPSSKGNFPDGKGGPKRPRPPAEGGFYEDMLISLGFQPKIHATVPRKRRQLFNALLSLAGTAKRLTIFIDEAQELSNVEYAWLKSAINYLAENDLTVVVVLFGQRELIDRRTDLIANGRSDLAIRFMQSLCEFETVKTSSGLLTILSACDELSDYPEGTGVTYTQFLWPRAFAAGFRWVSQAEAFWSALQKEGPPISRHGIAMQWIALTMSEFASITREHDSESFAPSIDLWQRAIKQSGYADITATG